MTTQTVVDAPLSRRQLADRLGMSPQSITRRVKEGILPQPIRLGHGPRARARWFWSEVEAALLAASRRGDISA